MMSILKKKPRHEVISIRLSEDRLKLLERYQKVLSERLRREVSLGEAAFLVIEERVEGMDRETARHEMLSTPTLPSITFARSGIAARTSSRRVGCAHALCADRSGGGGTGAATALACDSFKRILHRFAGCLRSGLCEAEESGLKARLVLRSQPRRRIAGVRTSDEKPEQNHQAVLKQIAARKLLLKPSEKWERPGSVARCLLVAIRDEEVESSKLDQVLAPFWPTLWGLAARAIRYGTNANRAPRKSQRR